MNADGSNQINLTNSRTEEGPAFSPDGSKIAFVSSRNGNFEIYVMNADGSGQTRLTNNPANDIDPSFSPDGSKIAFVSRRDGNFEIYVMNADGSGQTRLTNNPGFDSAPSFSPDGSKIAFLSNRDGNLEIYVMNADGSGQTRLTNNTVNDEEPAFSPDGSKIAFLSNRDGNFEIYVMNADGSNQINLTNNTADDLNPAFSPDGSKIAFASYRDGGDLEVYVMNADGSGQTRLTNNPGFDHEPSWGALVADQTITVSNTGDNGAGSLRQAILDANAAPGTQTIAFNISGTGVQSIALASPLPNITDAVVIDGYTQPVQVRTRQRKAATPSPSSNSTDRGREKRAASTSSPGARRCAASSSTASASPAFGWRSARAAMSSRATFIGTDSSGFESLPNLIGVEVTSSPNNLIGGTTPAARNVISANSSSGVHLFSSGAIGNAVRGNLIGTDKTGTGSLGNGQAGVLIDATASNNTIGGTEAGAGNRIGNSARNVVIDSGTGNAVLSNSIFSNSSALGIDLSPGGVTPNDAGDADEGANNLQNFPVLESAISSGANTVVQGALNSTANTNFTVQFFANSACHSSGNGEGQIFLGSTNVTTDANGDAPINTTLLSATAARQVVTATATALDANSSPRDTSEFSACAAVIVQTFTISGQVTSSASGCSVGIAGVTVTLSGDSSATTTTASDGSYQFTGLAPGGNYTVTPAGNFTPPSQTFNDLRSDQTANFCGVATAPPSSFFVSNTCRQRRGFTAPGHSRLEQPQRARRPSPFKFPPMRIQTARAASASSLPPHRCLPSRTQPLSTASRSPALRPTRSNSAATR
jgi:hypothetical protein